MAFEEELSQIAQSTTLGQGYVTASAAELMAKKQQATTSVLSALNKGLSAMDDDIQTTEEQLERLRLDPTAQNYKKDLTKTASELQAFTLNMADRQKKFGDTFTKGILALGVIGGEEAERTIDTLQKNKAETFARFEELKKMPLQDLQYRMLEQNFAWKSKEFDEYEYNVDFKKGTNTVADWITGYDDQGRPNIPEFELLTAGDYRTWSDDERRAYDRNFSTVMKKAQQMFQGTPNAERVLDGVKIAMQKTQKTLTFNKLQPIRTTGAGAGSAPALDSGLMDLLREATNNTDLFYSLSDEMIDAINRYHTNAELSIDDVAADVKTDPKRFKEYYDTFNPQGKYNNTLNKLKQWLTPLNTGERNWADTYLENAERDYIDEEGNFVETLNGKGETIKKKIYFKKFKDRVNVGGQEYDLGRLGLSNIMIPIHDNFIAPTLNRDNMFHNGGREVWKINNRGRNVREGEGFRTPTNTGVGVFDWETYENNFNNSNVFGKEPIFDDAFFRFEFPFQTETGDATNVQK